MSLSLARNLKLKRKQLGLTQQLMSDLLNLERSTYAYYETGKTSPSLETLSKLAAMFDCSIEDLLREADPGLLSEESDFTLKKPDPTEPIRVAKRLISKIALLPLSERLEVEKLVDELIENKTEKS